MGICDLCLKQDGLSQDQLKQLASSIQHQVPVGDSRSQRKSPMPSSTWRPDESAFMVGGGNSDRWWNEFLRSGDSACASSNQIPRPHNVPAQGKLLRRRSLILRRRRGGCRGCARARARLRRRCGRRRCAGGRARVGLRRWRCCRCRGVGLLRIHGGIGIRLSLGLRRIRRRGGRGLRLCCRRRVRRSRRALRLRGRRILRRRAGRGLLCRGCYRKRQG